VGKFARLLALCALTVPGVVMLAPGAWAEPVAQAGSTQSVNPDVLQTAWFWQTAVQQANPPVPPPAPPPTEPSGIPKGDLAVAHTSADGTSSKMSTIAFQITGLKTGATVNSFKLSISLDSSGGATQLNQSGAPIVACLPTRLWSPAEGGSANDEPPVDCSTKAAAKVSGSTYSFDISGIAQQWVGDANLGVALVNDPTNTSTPFQAAFAVKSIKASMRFTPPYVAPPNGHTGQLGGSGAGNGNGSVVGGGTAGSGGTVAAPPPAPVTLPPTGPTTTTTNPDATAQPPRVATPTTPLPVAVHKAAPSSPNTMFWVGAIAIAVLIVVAGAVLADDNVPAPTATTTRLSRVLRDRERAKADADASVADGLKTLSPRRV